VAKEIGPREKAMRAERERKFAEAEKAKKTTPPKEKKK
jgi:hypothetical protein